MNTTEWLILIAFLIAFPVACLAIDWIIQKMG